MAPRNSLLQTSEAEGIHLRDIMTTLGTSGVFYLALCDGKRSEVVYQESIGGGQEYEVKVW